MRDSDRSRCPMENKAFCCRYIWSRWTTNKTILLGYCQLLYPLLSRLIDTRCTSPISTLLLCIHRSSRDYLGCAHNFNELLQKNVITNRIYRIYPRCIIFCSLTDICLYLSCLLLSSLLFRLPFPFTLYAPGDMLLSQLFSVKLSRCLRVAICFDRGSHP